MTTLKPYDAYKESGIEWVGPIPAGWETRPLFAVARANTASNKAGTESNLLSLSYGRIVRKDIAGNEGLLPASFDTYQVIDRNDIVLRLTDLQNDKRSLRSAISPERGIVTSAYLALTPIKIRPKFLSYLLRAYDLQKVFYSMGGGLRQSMKFSDMKWLPVILPPESTQREVVAYLDRETAQIDELIGKQERLIRLLAEKRQSMITYAVTKGLDPTAPTKPSGIPWLGNIPAHWTVTGVKHFGRTASGAGFPHEFQGDESQPVPFHKVSSLATADEAGIISSRRDTVSHEVAAKLRAEVFPAGSLVLAKIGAALLLGRIRMLSEPSCIDNNMMAVTVSKRASPRFVYYALQQVDFKVLVNPGAVPSLSDRAFRAYKLAWPPLSEQAAIASKLDAQLARLAELQDKALKVISTLKERRSALISAAVTGKIKVDA